MASLLGAEAWSSSECSLTWKAQATKHGRLYFQLAVSALPTGATGYGLLLTPSTMNIEEPPASMRARAKKNGYRNGTKWNTLASQIRYGFLPTPTASDSKGARATRVRKGREGPKLPGVIDGMNPGRRLQPGFALWMMGYGWRDAALKGAGNAIVPQAAIEIFEAIKKSS